MNAAKTPIIFMVEASGLKPPRYSNTAIAVSNAEIRNVRDAAGIFFFVFKIELKNKNWKMTPILATTVPKSKMGNAKDGNH